MGKRIVVTGGAGFIGSFTVDLLLARGYDVVVLDSLEKQVHGPSGQWPDYLDWRVERIHGDVEGLDTVRRALTGAEAVLHLGAVVGVGQSMYEIDRYVRRNTTATARFLQILATEYTGQIKRLVVASSMSIYGEGAYHCEHCGDVAPKLRPLDQLAARDWKMHCPLCNRIVQPMPTSEHKPLAPTSIYAITKRDQEEMALVVGRAYDIPTIALRYFNVYGPRQSIANPYTGVGAIFSSRLVNGKPPLIFEDGLQARDFIHVRDIARANVLALECAQPAFYQAINIGTGTPTSILALAQQLANALDVTISPTIVNQFRQGDIRHCYADTQLAEDVLGFRAAVPLSEGIADLVNWVRHQESVDRVEQAMDEIDRHGLIR